jgi:histidine triad (HIT) family protein
MHLVPIDHIDDLNFKKPKLKLSDQEFRDIQEKIIGNLRT